MRGALAQFSDTEKWSKENKITELYENFDVEFYEKARRMVRPSVIESMGHALTDHIVPTMDRSSRQARHTSVRLRGEASGLKERPCLRQRGSCIQSQITIPLLPQHTGQDASSVCPVRKSTSFYDTPLLESGKQRPSRSPGYE
jgi:hypothetical protein